MLYNTKKLIKYAKKIEFNSKNASGVGAVGWGIFKTKTVIMMAKIASKNVSNLFVCMN
jgi:hypothetical protein